MFLSIFLSAFTFSGESPENTDIYLEGKALVEVKKYTPVNDIKKHQQKYPGKSSGATPSKSKKVIRTMKASKQELAMLDLMKPLIHSWFEGKVKTFAGLMRLSDHLPHQTAFDTVWTCLKGSEYFHLIYIMRALVLCGETSKAEMLANSLDYSPLTRSQLLKWLAMTDENALEIKPIDIKLQSLSTSEELKKLIESAKSKCSVGGRDKIYGSYPAIVMPNEAPAVLSFQEPQYIYGDNTFVATPDLSVMNFSREKFQHEIAENKREKIIKMLSEGNLDEAEYEVTGRCLKSNNENTQLIDDVKLVFSSYGHDFPIISTSDHYGSLFEVIAALSGEKPIDLFTDIFIFIENFVLRETESNGELLTKIKEKTKKSRRKSYLLQKKYENKWRESRDLSQLASDLMIQTIATEINKVTVRKFIHKFLWRNEQDLISLLSTCNYLNMEAVILYPTQLSDFGDNSVFFSGVSIDRNMIMSVDIEPDNIVNIISGMSSLPVIFLCLGEQWCVLHNYNATNLCLNLPEILHKIIDDMKIRERLELIKLKDKLKPRSGKLVFNCANGNVLPCVCENIPCNRRQHIAYCFLLSVTINALEYSDLDIDSLVETHFVSPLLINHQKKSKVADYDFFQDLEFTPEAIKAEVNKLKRTCLPMFPGDDKTTVGVIVNLLDEIANYLQNPDDQLDAIIEKMHQCGIKYDALLRQCHDSVVASQMDLAYQLVSHHPLMRLMRVTPHSLADINVCYSLLLRLCNLQSISNPQKMKENEAITLLADKVFEERTISGFQKGLIDLCLKIRTELPLLSLEPLKPMLEKVTDLYKSIAESGSVEAGSWRSKQLILDLDDSTRHEHESLVSAAEQTPSQVSKAGRPEGYKESAKQVFLFEQLCKQWGMHHINELCDNELSELAVDIGLDETLQQASSAIFDSDAFTQHSHFDRLLPASGQQEQSVALELQAVASVAPKISSMVKAKCRTNSCEWRVAANYTFTSKLTPEAYVVTHAPSLDLREFAQCSRSYRRYILENQKQKQIPLGDVRGLLPLASLLSVRNLTREKTKAPLAVSDVAVAPVEMAMPPKRPVAVSEESGTGYKIKAQIVTNSVIAR